MLELRLCGGVEVEADGRVLAESLLGGRQGRLVLAYLACERQRPVRREELADLLWPDELPDSWATSLSAVVSRLRRLCTEAGHDGGEVVVSSPGAYQLVLPAGSRVDVDVLASAVRDAEDAATRGETGAAVAAASRAESIASRGFLGDDCEWVDAQRASIRDLRVRAAIARSEAHLGEQAWSRAIDAARHAVALDEAKEAGYRQLMRALTAAGERAEALRVWERCRITLVEELGVDPSPETEAIYLALLEGGTGPGRATRATELPSGVVTFLLTDIVESSALWEDATAAMAVALERHDAIVAGVVAAHGGTLLKSKLEGDATVSVFARATECAAAALALLDAIESEAWPDGAEPRLRIAMHTGEAFERDGDYFGPALNRAARLRGLAAGGEVLLSQAVAELVQDHLPDGVILRDRGHQALRGLSRGETVSELTRAPADGRTSARVGDAGKVMDRPALPSALTGSGPFVGRGHEMERLGELWRATAAGAAAAVFIGGEPGVGKSRLAGELAARADADGAIVLYGRCDEDLAAPLQPFIEAVRVLAPALGPTRLRAVRGVDELTRVVPELTELLGEQPGVRADPDTERLALFDALTQLLVVASAELPTVLVLDDLHWAGKTTLSLLRHLLRGTRSGRLLVVGTYRDTELARTHPLAETLADLRRDPDTHRISLGGLAETDVAAYLTAIGNADHALGRELAEVTAGNPFFLIEVVRHVEESGGVWQPGSLPEGVRETTGRRLSRLSNTTNDALAVAAVVGTTFDLALVEQVCGADLVDPIAEAVAAGLVVEETGALDRFRFAHAIVRQVLLAELVSLKRVRLHRTIAELLEARPSGADDADARLVDLAYHWFECASTGSADQAVAACRRAADRAMERLAYEEAGDLYGMALQAQEWVVEADPEVVAALHLARCDALLTAGDVAEASTAIDALEVAAAGSERLAAWYTTYEGLLAVLGEPERLTEIVQSIAAAAAAMRDAGDLAGEAKARYVHALALERLGRIGPAERALDEALAAARAADDRRLADTVLAEAPPAHLWGPTPVTRASGRCLDVVRVLRITSGTRAVHAVALRCQAVLEALRGRTDAARRLIASSRRTVEELGLTHRRLETELAAGLIELLDGEAAAAETMLRLAFEGFEERGLDGEAAQAAAFLGRALLLLDRVDDADAAAARAADLAGADLKAAITWRDVRARVAARRGDLDRALTLAREAVDLAGATDALLLVGDARLTLAEVLRQRGDDAAAAEEARRAVTAYDAKGATVLAALAREIAGAPTSEVALGADATPAPPVPTGANLATVAMDFFRGSFNRGDWDAVAASHSDRWRIDDRRPIVGMEARGDDTMTSGVFARSGGGRLEAEVVATRGARLALGRWCLRSPDVEVPFLAITAVDAEGRGDAFVMFEPEAVDEAIEVLDRMAGVAAWENDATRTMARFHGAFHDRDWDAVLDRVGDGYVVTDRRLVVGTALDHDAALSNMRWVFDGGGRFEDETLATRGRTCALLRITLRLEDPEAAGTVLAIEEVDGAGRLRVGSLFDPDDLEDARAELDRVFRAGEGAEHVEVLDLGTTLISGMSRWDRAATRPLLAPDFVLCSHRRIRRSEVLRTADEFLADLGRFAALGSDAIGEAHEAPRVDHVTRLSAGAGIWSVTFAGRLADGGPFEIPLVLVLRFRDGAVARLDIFDEQDADAAIAVLDRHAPPNRAWHAARRHADAHEAGDRDAYVAATDPEFVYVDHRTGIQVRFEGEAAVDAMQEGFDLDEVRYDRDPVASRGDDLVVTRDRFWFVDRAAGPSEVRNLALVESGPDGRVRGHTAFDPDDLDTAIAALDARWAELGGDAGPARTPDTVGTAGRAGPNLAGRASLALTDALNRNDEAAVRALFAPAHVNDDRRRGVRLRLEGPRALDPFLLGVSMDHYDETRVLVATRGDHLALSRASGTFRDGLAGPSEVQVLLLVECAADGRIVATATFDPGDEDVALVALDTRSVELGGAVSTLATRAALEYSEAWLDATRGRRDWASVHALRHPDYVNVDRRHGVQLRLDADDAVRLHEQAIGLLDVGSADSVVAVRGERLVLTRHVVTFVGGGDTHEIDAEVAFLSLQEYAPDGRVVSQTMFEVDDTDAALAALDARWAELRDSGERASLAWRAALAITDARIRRDWDALVATFAPDVVSVDRRTGVQLRLDGAEAFDVYRAAMALDHYSETRTLVATRGDLLALTRVVASFDDGVAGPSEVEALILVECGRDARIVATTTFDPDDQDAALAALDTRWADLHAPGERPNLAWRASLALTDAENRRDWAALVATFAPDVVSVDRRTGVQLRLEGAEALDAYRAALALDHFAETRTLVATRGEWLALGRAVARFDDGDVGPSEVESLILVECGSDGRVVATTTFDPEDEADALGALDARCAELEGGNEAWRARRRQMDACNRRDWSAFEASVASEYALDDRRLVVRRRESGDDAMNQARALFDLDESWWRTQLLATRGDRLALTRDVVGFRDGAVGPAEIPSAAVVECDDEGRILTVTAFDVDDEDTARAFLDARFTELEAGNEAWRARQREMEACNRRDGPAFEDVVAPGYVLDLRRRVIRQRFEGDAALASRRLLVDLDDVQWETELLATRGEHLAAVRDTVRFVDGAVGPSEVVTIGVVECRDDGRITSLTGFDPDAVDEAIAYLDARFAELGAGTTPESAAWRVSRLQAEVSNRRDRQALNDLTAPGFVYTDRRRFVRMELVGADALDAIEIGMHLDDFRWDRELVETRGERLALTRDVFRFVDGVGGEAETESVSVNECDASGRLVAVTAFDADALPRALDLLEARYAELGPEEVRRVSTAPPVPGNAAWRATWRMRDCALRGDWDGFVDNLDGLVQTDLRRGLGMRISGDDVLAMNRILFGVDDLRWETTLLATRGDRLALVRHAVRFVDGAAGPSEIETVNVEECGPDGRLVAVTILDPDDLARAHELLDARHAELGAG